MNVMEYAKDKVAAQVQQEGGSHFMDVSRDGFTTQI